MPAGNLGYLESSNFTNECSDGLGQVCTAWSTGGDLPPSFDNLGVCAMP